MKIAKLKIENSIVTLLIIVLIIAIGIYAYSRLSTENNSPTISTENTRQYKNIERGFSIDYPESLLVKDFDEGETTHTIVFSEEVDGKNFQIFFTPYLGNQVTQERINMDIPDGKIIEPVDIVIGEGITALAFFSNSKLGELREVWFIHDGYLYQLTTYKEWDEWLANIMKSWKFI